MLFQSSVHACLLMLSELQKLLIEHGGGAGHTLDAKYIFLTAIFFYFAQLVGL